MGVLEVRKLVGDGLTCPTRVLHVSDTCFCNCTKCAIMSMYSDFIERHVSDTCRARETITNQFPDLKNPHLESKIIKIGQDIYHGSKHGGFFLGHGVVEKGMKTTEIGL